MADDPLTDDDLAAEYVLGVQDAETRDRLAQRIGNRNAVQYPQRTDTIPGW